MNGFDDCDEEMEYLDRVMCENCDDMGKVPTYDYESYLGAMYKPCYMCNGTATQASIGERELS